MIDKAHLDQLVDVICNDFGIRMTKPRSYELSHNRVSCSCEQVSGNLVGGSSFYFPQSILEDEKALEGYFAHEIAELSRISIAHPFQQLRDYFTTPYRMSYKKVEEMNVTKENFHIWTFHYFVASLFLIPSTIIDLINNVQVDNLASSKGYGDSIKAYRKLMPHISVTSN